MQALNSDQCLPLAEIQSVCDAFVFIGEAGRLTAASL
jgi:hypothetical protein